MHKEYENIGKNIKDLREQSKITQKSLAQFLEVDQSLISKIEKNERSITSDLLDKIASLFGIPTEAFFKKEINAKPISFSFRANKITPSDLETISYINKIALNLEFMNSLSGENND